jgi:WS/DGAT/MGAT family acyltransferase
MTLDQLTALDSSFVWFEGPQAPAVVGAVSTFEAAPLLDGRGRLRLDDIRERTAARLDALPRLRRRLAVVPYDLGRPAWIDDPDFDIANHVRELRLPPPGDEAALRRVAEDLHRELLPRDRPLWDLVLVTGLDGDRVGLVERIHHALVDGVGGVDLATILLDLEPDAPAVPLRRWSAEPWPSDAELVAASLRQQVGDSARTVQAAVRGLRHPLHAVRAAGGLGKGLATVADDGLFAPHTSLNGRLQGGRRLAWVRARLDEVKATAHRAGGSVNDVMLAVVGGGLRALFLGRGEPLAADLVLKVLVPVSVRTEGEHGALGNRVGAVYAPLPVGIGDPAARLAAIVASMRRLKSRPEARTTEALLGSADALPAGAAHLISRAILHQPFVNLVVTNVPGPPVPLYAVGARMLEAFPVVPLGANLTVGVAVLSYDGALTISVTADAGACPDVDVFAEGMARSLAGYLD